MRRDLRVTSPRGDRSELASSATSSRTPRLQPADGRTGRSGTAFGRPARPDFASIEEELAELTRPAGRVHRALLQARVHEARLGLTAVVLYARESTSWPIVRRLGFDTHGDMVPWNRPPLR